jgi:Tol biopolymer transport system component
MSDPLEQLKAALEDRYQIDRELGRGGMATVYLARDLRHERAVALKVLRPDLAAALGSERFLREIRIAANLNHPHILALFDSGDADGFLYYVMPYVKGQTLRDRIDKEGELPIPETVRIVRAVVDALAFAHGEGVVHRDIKPDNIMLAGGHAVVADFGIAKAVSESTGSNKVTTAGVALGTPAYMAPEQAAADPQVDHRADIYAVGALTYELLTGRPPFTGATPQAVLAAHVTQPADPVSRYRDQVSGELEAVVMKCLAKKPADRWQAAGEMLPHLDNMTTTSGGITPAAIRPLVAPRRFSPAGIAIAIAALVILAAVWFSGVLGGGTTAAPIVQQQLTTSGNIRHLAISPDGQSLAYNDAEGTLFIRDVGADAGALTRRESGAFSPVWHPDGGSLLYMNWDDFALYQIPKLSGDPVRILSPGSRVSYAYDPDGAYLIGGAGHIYWGSDPASVDWIAPDSASLDGGRLYALPEGVTTGFGGGERLSLSPDRRWIAYLGTEDALAGVIGVVATDGSGGSTIIKGKAMFISSGGRVAWSTESDAIYYLAGTGNASNQAVYRAGIDPRTGQADGSDVMVFDGALPRQFDIAPDGKALALVGGNAWYNVYTGTGAGPDPVRMERVTTGTAWTASPGYSADGRTLTFSRFAGLPPQGSLHRRDLATGEERAIQLRGLPCCVSLSPDGARAAYNLLGAGGTASLWVVDWQSEASETVGEGSWWTSIVWAPDGTSLVSIPADRRTVTHIDLERDSTWQVAYDDLTEILAVALSPDTSNVALFATSRDGTRGLWVGAITGGAVRLVRADVTGVVAWTDDGILYQGRDHLSWVSPEGGAERVYARSAGLADCSLGGVAADPATGAFACAVNESSTDLVWVTGVEF